MAMALFKPSRTMGTQGCDLYQSSFARAWYTDTYGGSCPGCPAELPAMESFQIAVSCVSAFRYSAHFSLFLPYLKRQAPVVQKVVPPWPPLGYGRAPKANVLASLK